MSGSKDEAVHFGGGIIHTIPDGWHTIGEAAKLVGRSEDTLKRWRRNGTFRPSGFTRAGKLRVNLYSDEDIESLKQIALTKKPGRKPAS